VLGGVLQIVAHVLFVDGSRHLSGVPEKIEIFAHVPRTTRALGTTAESVIIEIVTGFLELVT
jgi:hypothetical protein